GSDKAVYSVGETAKLSVLSGLPEGLAYLDVHRGGQTVAMQASLLEDGQAVFEVPVGIGWDGEVVAVATLFPDDQGPQFTAQRTVFVHRHKELKVTFSTDKPLYRPGDPLKLSLSVVDESDGPLQAAVGLTVVDEALYAIQDSKPGLLWKVFEAGGRIADPVFTFAFPKTDLVGLLGEALPEPGEAFEHFQRLTAAAFAALSKLEVYTASVSNAAQQGAAAQGNAYSLTASQVGWFESQLAAMWRDEGWDSEDLVAFVLAHDWADPWGVLYQVEDTGGWVLFRSAGMDEKFGTADDISVSPSVCDIDYYACEWEVTVCDSSGYYYGSPDVAADLPSPSEDAAAEPLASGGKAVKVRKWFPETLYVDPAIITDEQGKATVEMPLADSITQWRATGLANAASGRLGSAVHGITVFQDFFVDPDLPVSYTRGDEIKFPVAVYNYLSEEQAVTVSIKQEDWFTPLGPVSQAITMPADAVDAVYFSVRIEKAGWHALTVEAFGPKAQDAVARQVQVLPGGE
ncbi:MAG: hypothetical protein FJ109_22110, partial [Deltaproteobacteria bacterium]|nr:hypothetical protein [Deltaproteobacteria bacterium]